MTGRKFTFISHEPQLGYFRYADAATGQMLIASPGESYAIRPVEEGLPVPPDDGRWDPPYVRPAPENGESQDTPAGPAPNAAVRRRPAPPPPETGAGTTTAPAGDESAKAGE